MNSEENFPDYVAKVLSAIQEMNEVEIKTEELQLSPGYVSLPVRFLPDGTNMKIDFVNDLPYHVGAYKKDVLFNKIDSIDNILANKITAIIGRTETKDIVDLWTICNHHGFFWNTAIDNAFQKEANIDIAFISASLGFISKKEFEDIKWIQKPNWETFKNDLQIIVGDMINLSKNSLY